jgi:hypothetical protein
VSTAEVQRVPLGRPNRVDDGQPMMLDEAVNASIVSRAYTRLERDERHPQARVVSVEQSTDSEWQVFEYLLGDKNGGASYRGWPMRDYAEAEAYCAYRLAAPRAPMWWPAWGPLSVESELGHFWQPPTGMSSSDRVVPPSP